MPVFLPVGTSEPIQRRPYVTYLLALTNLLVYLGVNIGVGLGQSRFALINVFDEWGFVPAAREPITFLTYQFLHGGLGHLLGNMWFLLLFGRIVEDRLGHVLFLFLYLGTGVCAALVQDAFTIGTLQDVTGSFQADQFAMMMGRVGRDMPMIGASGSVFGVVGALLVLALWAEFRVVCGIILVFYNRVGTVKLITPFVCAFYLLVNFLGAWIDYVTTQRLGYSVGGVAVYAHLGGFAAGLGVALLARRFLRFLLPLDPHEIASVGDVRRGRELPVMRVRRRGGLDPEQRAVEELMRLLHQGRTAVIPERFIAHSIAFPGFALPAPQMCEVAEILSRANTATHARSAFERVLSVAEPGPIRRRALLGLGRLLSADPRHHATADSHLRELLTLNPDTDNREEAERLLTDMRRRTAEPSHPMSTSSLTRELEARARGELSDHPLDETPIPPASRTTPLQPAYVPEPAPTRSPERFAPPSPSPYAPPEGLPPPRPIYIPPETIGEANVEPTHAVILTGHQRIDVPRVAQIIGRATKQAMVQASRQIAQGMGVVFLTADPLVARQVASLLNGNRLTAAVVELDAVPRNWEESRLFSASVRNDQVTLGLDDEGAESLWINDLLAIAHGVVALEPNDPNPPLVADLLTKSGRRLRALESQFQHATPGEPETLSSFMVHLAARAPRVMRDAALDNVIRANRHSCMRFDSVEAFEAYEKWLTFSAIAASR